MRLLQFRAVAVLSAAFMALSSTGGHAQTKADYQTLNTALTNMGYTTTAGDQQITFKTAQGYFHGFVNCGMGKIDAYVAFTVFPRTKINAAAEEAALRFNDTHTDYFSISDNTATTYAYALNLCFTPDKISAANLQTMIGSLENDASAQRAIWDPTLWK